MKKTSNILFCGVGGQGILLASEITSQALISSGLDVKKSEVHGMAQRGGVVVAHLKYGEKVYSPLIEFSGADIEVAFEMLESMRYLPYLNKKTRVIVNTQKILPVSVLSGGEQYPEDIVGHLRSRGLSVFPVNAFETAKAAGEAKAVNMVLVGGLSLFLPVKEKVFLEVINKRVPENFLKANIEAFMKGKKIIKSMIGEQAYDLERGV